MVARYSTYTNTYSPKNERQYSPHKSPLAQPEDRYSPIKSPLVQEEMYSPPQTHRTNTKTSPVRNSSVMSGHRHDTDNFRPRSLVFSTPVKKE